MGLGDLCQYCLHVSIFCDGSRHDSHGTPDSPSSQRTRGSNGYLRTENRRRRQIDGRGGGRDNPNNPTRRTILGQPQSFQSCSPAQSNGNCQAVLNLFHQSNNERLTRIGSFFAPNAVGEYIQSFRSGQKCQNELQNLLFTTRLNYYYYYYYGGRRMNRCKIIMTNCTVQENELLHGTACGAPPVHLAKRKRNYLNIK